MGGTRGSGIVSSAADVLGMSMVRGMRGDGGMCEMCIARSCEWKRGLDLGSANRVVGGLNQVMEV